MNALLYDPAPSPAAIAGFCAIVFAVTAAVVAGVSVAARRLGANEPTVARRSRYAALALLLWLGATFGLAASGLLARFDSMPPPFMLLMGATFLWSTLTALSGAGGMLARGLPIAALVGFHAFRLPLELVLHRLSLDRVLPVQMTFDGMNFDIATGITAIAVALWAAVATPPRAVLMLWNLFGLALLTVIVTIAILSLPLPFRVFLNEPASTLVTTAPFVWLPTVLVQAAWIGHLLLFRRLLQRTD